MNQIAIFGAAGAIGQAIAPELERRGMAFRVVGRSKEKLTRAFGHMKNAEIFAADLNDFRSAAAAAREIDTIVYCVGLPYPMHSMHPVMMRTTLQAAKTMKVPRLLLISSVYGYGVPRTALVAETHPREPAARKGKFRKEQEDLAMAAHAAGDIQSTILRLPDFYGPHSEIGLADMIFKAAMAGKTANWPGPLNAAHEFVFTPDVGPVALDLIARPDAFGEAWNFAGPGPINALDFITRIYRAAGHAPKYRGVGKTMLTMLGWFDANIREAIEMLYLQETPVLMDDRKLLAKLGKVSKTPYDQGIQKTLDWLTTQAPEQSK